MSGGAFDYSQYRIDDIVNRIENEIERATCERPEPIKRTYVSTMGVRKNSHGSTSYRYLNYGLNTLEDAREYFETLGYKIKDVDENEFEIIIADDEYIKVSKCEETVYLDEDGEEMYFPEYTERTLDEFRKGVEILKKASIYANRIDWLLSGDDGEDSFYERLNEELEELKNGQGNKTKNY
jgi:hypothetical protein